MEQEFLKRNTDCVYFLASPLTCKKGVECEYRHNDIARLNPRDCWYWLAGSCLNLTCAFRHPPLDMHLEKSSESAFHFDHKSTAVNKTVAPCHYFLNGFCIKGDKCSFLHGQDDSKHALKYPASNQPLEKKIATGSNIGSTRITKPNPYPSEPKPSIKIPNDSFKQELLKLSPNKTEERSNSPRTKTPMILASEEDDNSEDLDEDEAERFAQIRPVVCIDQSSDENDDQLESSQGFDVLVEDRLQNILGYEHDNPDYMLNDQYRLYDYEDDDGEEEDIIRYNHLITDIPLLDDSTNDRIYSYTKRTPILSKDRIVNNSLPDRKRRMFPTETNWKSVDLRNRLKNQRVVFGQSSQRNHSRFPERFSVPAANNLGRAHFKNSAPFKGKQRGTFQNRGKLTRKPALKKRKTSQEKTGFFTGPKSLNQIKEEKKRFRKYEEDFQGPKPLSEILKDKRTSQVDPESTQPF